MPRKRDDSKALYIGNLRQDCRRQELKRLMVLAHHKFNVLITIKSIFVVEKPENNYAFVYYNSNEDLQTILLEFSENGDLTEIRDLVAPSRKLKLGLKHSSSNKSPNVQDTQDAYDDTEDVSVDPLNKRLNHLQHIQSGKNDRLAQEQHKSWQYIPGSNVPAGARKSSSLGATNNSNNAERPLPMHLTPQSALSDTLLVYHGANAHGHIDPDRVSCFRYVQGARLGNETRCVEFKCGQGGYIRKQLMQHVAKYMCAFLNSEGGVLVIGVVDDGTVRGIHGIDRKTEDHLRLRIDGVVKGMSPKVFPAMYRASFIDVLDKNGHPIPDTKVIEVEVEQGTASQLYETDRGDVFIRRDGSVQGPLKASDIQEWTRIQLTKEMDKLTKEIGELEANRTTNEETKDGATGQQQQQQQQQEVDRLQRSRSRLAECNAQLESDRQALLQRNTQLELERDFYKKKADIRQSKICVIS